MQQLSFLEPPPQQIVVPVWHSLDEEQRALLVARLARLIANAIAHDCSDCYRRERKSPDGSTPAGKSRLFTAHVKLWVHAARRAFCMRFPIRTQWQRSYNYSAAPILGV